MYQNPMKTCYKVQMHLLFRQCAVCHAAESPAQLWPAAQRARPGGQAQRGRGRPGTLTLGRAFGGAWLLWCPALSASAGIERRCSVTLFVVFCLPYFTPPGEATWAFRHPHDRTRSRDVVVLCCVSSAQGLPGPAAQPCRGSHVGC